MDDSPVVCPPFVAGPLRMSAFHALSLSPGRVGDPATARTFARPHHDAAARLARWESSGHLRRDPEPAVYLHEYSVAGVSIRGLVGALDLSRRADRAEDQVVLPHEGVHPLQVADLADRMTRMQLNPAPILLVHRGPDAVRDLVRAVAGRRPDHEFVDRADHRNRVWAIRDPERLALLELALDGARPLIADGHHRYAAYLRMQEQAPGTGADRGLAMLVDQGDTPLFAGAIHRVFSGTTLDQLTAAAEGLATVRTDDASTSLARLGPRTLVATDGRAWAALELAPEAGTEARTAVEVLHEQVLPRLEQPPRRTAYHHSVDEALAHVPSRRGVVVLMPAADVDTIVRVVGSGRLLPEKATSFQPKPGLGVLMRSLRDG